MRTINSFKNLIAGIGISLVMILLGFFTRKIFVDEIGVEYLGLNGLLQNILGIMTLLEGGFASSVIYNLYKPLSQNDQPKIIALIQLYRKVYRYIAAGIFVFGLLVYPFLHMFIPDSRNLDYLAIVYFIFLFNSLIQYFTAYKYSLINASQQAYKLAPINITYQVSLSIAKIAILYYTKNYILYLVVESLFGVLLNIGIVWKANQLFPYIKTKVKYKVDKDVKKSIVTNMRALFLHSLGGYFMHSTDNIIMSSFIGVGIVGLYSNYTLITSTVKSFTNQILNSISESVGNLIASESSIHSYSVFQTVFFCNFIVVSIPVVILYMTFQPFVSWWLGDEYLLSNVTVGLILLNFYVDNMRTSALTFKVKSGIFVQDKYTPLLQGIINLILSIILVRVWGIAGVLLSTAISIISIGFWQWPRLIYKYTFKLSPLPYFLKYALYTLTMLTSISISYVICLNIHVENTFLKFIANGAISFVITISVYFVSFYRTKEVRQLKPYLSLILSKVKHFATKKKSDV